MKYKLSTPIPVHKKYKITTLLTNDQIVQITNYVNAYRATNQVAGLAWDGTIALFSQNWSDYLLANTLFQHSGTQLYG